MPLWNADYLFRPDGSIAQAVKKAKEAHAMKAAPMTTPSLPEAAKLAIAALERTHHIQDGASERFAAADALRAALSASAEPMELDDDATMVDLWAEIHRLRAAVKGPDGYASWQDAAVDERIRRVRAEKAIATPPAQAEPSAQEPAAWREMDGDDWVYYHPGDKTFEHIAEFQKDRHGISIFPLYTSPQTSASVAGSELDWPEAWKRDGWNGCMLSAIAALQFLANNDRPSGGSSNFNSEHLFQIASELGITREKLLAPSTQAATVAAAAQAPAEGAPENKND